jgi:hypothetical protein
MTMAGDLYNEAARQALTVLWEVGDRVCSKRLKALIPVLIDAMERVDAGFAVPAVDSAPAARVCDDSR